MIMADAEATSEYLVEPKYLLDVQDFLSDDIWQDSWSNSLLYYHPEYVYQEYSELVCSNLSTVRSKKHFFKYI